MSDKHPEVFNRYDIRGDYPEEIDEDFSKRLGMAVASYAREKDVEKVVVGRDTRDNSKEVSDALVEGLREGEVQVIDVGVGTTDRTALASSFYGAIGVMVTASHHSWSRTGFKLLYREGYGFSNEDLDRVKELYMEERPDAGPESRLLRMEAEFDERYIERMLEFTEKSRPGEGKVVLDCCNGGAVRTAPIIFEEAGFEVIELNCSTDEGGVDPEPKRSNRDYIVDKVKETGADLGVAFDPDADRAFIYHPDKGWLDGNHTFYLLANILDADKIAASIDTADILESLDADIEYSRVGDVFVSAKGHSIGADLLGEPNGHFAITDFCWYNSGILASLLLALNYKEIPEMLDNAPQVFTEKTSYSLEEEEYKRKVIAEAIKHAKKNYEVVSTVDGVKFKGEGFEALVRPSGTSAKIRIVVNSDTEKRASEILEELGGKLFD
ncbi:MAG: hypothetical protein SVV03_01720 [Candidatus Nanohaloarchaea archaeon]|nr:hypothetical protein [Candidatus Nanohaloarchaea archaeon]